MDNLVTSPAGQPSSPPLQTSFFDISTKISTPPGGSGISRPWVDWYNALFKLLGQLVAATTQLQNIPSYTQATLPANLNPSNAGLTVFVTDYNHLLQWNGTSWQWGPGDDGSGYVEPFLIAPTNPAGWHVCDGSTVSYLQANGTLGSITLPNYGTAAYLKFGSAAIPGPTAPSGETEAVSAGTPAGTNAAVTSGDESADSTVELGIGATVAAQNHTHSVPAQPFTGAPMATHQHGPGTIDLENTQLLAYFRQ